MDGAPVVIPGAKPRAILTMLGLHGGSVVPADVLMELLWGDDPPRTAVKALLTHISGLRHALGDGFVLTEGTGWRLNTAETDASRYQSLTRSGRDALAAGNTSAALIRFDEAVTLWRGVPELPDGRRGVSEKTRWIEAHAALIEDRADALLATGRAAEIIGDLEAAVADAPLRERRWGQLMLALYRAGRQGEALGAYRRARSLLADELGVDPGPELRRLEAAIVAQDAELDVPATQHVPSVTRAVTFLLTDIEGSTAAWEADAGAMALALARHDELVEQIVTSRGGRLIKTRGEGDATFSVFDRPSAAAAAAIELQDAIFHEPWALAEPMRIRISLHTGEAELRDGDYFGRAVNRAARLRSQASGGQILCSGATAELVIDSLSDDVALVDLGMRQLKNLARPEHIFELRLQSDESPPPTGDIPIERPMVPAVLEGPGPFVGRGRELAELLAAWQSALTGGTAAVLIAGEPGVGKTRLAGEWCRQAYAQGAVVLYGRSDEDLGAPYQPFAEALRTLVPCVGTGRLRGMRGVEALLPLVPGLSDVLPDLAAPPHGDPDTERYALFDAVVALLGLASVDVPIVLVLDDLHWAAKPTLLLLRHLLRFGEHARVQIIGTYRSTDLDRSHPLAAMLADLRRDGSANRIALGGLDEDDVSAYVAEAGYDDEELARALASVTGGNPFFLIEALRHVDESGGHWDPSTLPQGVREAVSRRLSRLPVETNKALAAAAVVGSQFPLDLVEHVVGQDLVDAFDEACQAGIIIEEPGGLYRFNHAIVRQSLLAELASVRRMRLHQRIATRLETMPGADDELLSELAHHYFECAWAGNAVKAVEYCRRAADQAMARLAYEGAADLYDHALHALEELDDELPDRDNQRVELLVARCEALLAAGEVSSAASAVSQLKEGTRDSARLAAWATCFEGQLSMLVDPERLDEIECAVAEAAVRLAELHDAAGEAKAHTVRAGCLARLGRVADCELALDNALTAARHAGEHRLVNAVLAGAPLAALWGPNPVPRAGGRCLDVVRLLRITTDSPAVEATSTRCQAVLEAFRGRAAAARRMIDSARRTVTELGLRHALLEVDHFAGIVELVLDDPAAAELHLRLAYNGFRRMGLDADAAETAALLARACLLLDRDVEADQLCSESERLAGHALKASITWRTVRAQLLARDGAHTEARRVAEEAVAIAERTDALVDHGDACLALATVLGAAGDVVGARAAAARATELYERKGAVALAEKARGLVGKQSPPTPSPDTEAPVAELDNACIRVCDRLIAAVDRKAWDEVQLLFAPSISIESRRQIVGFPPATLSPSRWAQEMVRYLQVGMVFPRHVPIAVHGERLSLGRLEFGTADRSSGAPKDEMLVLLALDEKGRIALQVWFDIEDIDAAIAELDATYERFEALRRKSTDEAPQRLLDTACTRASERALAAIGAEAWDEFEQMFAPEGYIESRRKLVGFERTEFSPRDVMHQTRHDLENGMMRANHVVVAVRGERLALARVSVGTVDESPGAPQDELLQLYEIDEHGRFALQIWFDLDDMDAALAELDEQYARFEALHSRVPVPRRLQAHFDVVPENGTGTDTACVRAIRRLDDCAAREDWGELDQVFAPRITLEGRRKIVGFTRIEYSPSEWAGAAQIFLEIGVVRIHRVLVAVRGERLALVRSILRTADEGPGAPRDELLHLFGLDVEGRISLQMSFDVEDMDAALAELDGLHTLFGGTPQVPLENNATLVYRDILANFAVRNWRATREILAEDISTEDRRRVVNAGRRQGRDAVLAEISGIADVGITELQLEIIATRGRHLALSRCRASATGRQPESFRSDLLDIIEVNADNQVLARIVFDPEDIDAAFAELDARYLAGETAAHAHTWSVIAAGYDAFNRREVAATTPEWVSVDHRRGAAFQPGDMIRYIQAAWADSPDTRIHIEAVHRLTDRGAVVTHFAHGISQDGFAAEWRDIHLLTVDGEKVSRSELFDATDLDAALARFDEVTTPAERLETTAIEVVKCFYAQVAEHNWDAVAEILAVNYSGEDRRRVVGAGIRLDREAAIASTLAIADLSVTLETLTVIATRGERLVLSSARYSREGDGTDGYVAELLGVVEIDADSRIASLVTFDLDDIAAAFDELDARYLAGEAAPCARAWSVIARNVSAFNRREPLLTTPDWVTIDHRRATAFEPGDITPYIHATWDVAPDINLYIESVHRLSDLGAIFSQVLKGTSHEGFDAEWRDVIILTTDGEQLNSLEVFDEADLDAALTRFEELSRRAPKLENTVSHMFERFQKCLADGDLATIAAMLADNFCADDRRHFVGSGVRHGRDAAVEDARTVTSFGARNSAATVVATRGERLALRRSRYDVGDKQIDAFHVNVLEVVVMDTDERIAALVTFDPDDLDAALHELDERYLAGEAGPHAQTWSAICRISDGFNHREAPAATPNWVNIDHRRATAFAPGEMTEYLRATWDLSQEASLYVETVHRLNTLGAVITQSAQAISREGFHAEWRVINLLMVEGELISRCEVFDEDDLDAALAKFDELSRQSPQLANIASRTHDDFIACFTARDWAALAELLAAEAYTDDRRRVVNTGVIRGRDAVVHEIQALADIGGRELTSEVIAIRGERLVLRRTRYSGSDDREAYRVDCLEVLEADSDGRLVARVAYDPDDIDAALAELDARYLAGEAAVYTHTWSVMAQAYAALNRHELPATKPDWVNIDHRRAASFAPGEVFAYLHATWELMPNYSMRVAAVHRLDNHGAVVTHTAYGKSHEGFDASWRLITIFTIDGDLLNHCELFDEDDLVGALARFEELSRPAPRLKNTASQIFERIHRAYTAGDWGTVAVLLADDAVIDDRRPFVGAGVGRGREAAIANGRAVADVGMGTDKTTTVAIRGKCLALMRVRVSVPEGEQDRFNIDAYQMVETDADERVLAIVVFALDDLDAAFAELDSRYVAGEAAAHARTWSAIAGAYAGLNRRELPQMTRDWVSVDRRRVTPVAPGDLIEFIHAAWELERDICNRIEAVHQLNDLGAVITWVSTGKSLDGFDAEWRGTHVLTAEGDSIKRLEMFDEADLDTALARFDELTRPTPRLENAATRAWTRFIDAFNRRDVDGLLASATTGGRMDDRRKGLRAVMEGPERQRAFRALFTAPGSWQLEVEAIAVRGSRLSLTHETGFDTSEVDRSVTVELLTVVELGDGDLVRDTVSFDLDDIEAAFAELDTRYLDGEAAQYAQAWSLIMQTYAAFNRRELLPTVPDWASIDHRHGIASAQFDVIRYAQASWETTPDIRAYVEAVHRLNDHGAVVTAISHGTSQEGFHAEWRDLHLLTLEGGLGKRFELFDESDLDAALARFDELGQQPPT